MKYFCRMKGSSSCYGIGNTIEEAYADYQQDEDAELKDMEWFAMSPVKVRLVIDTSTKKETKK